MNGWLVLGLVAVAAAIVWYARALRRLERLEQQEALERAIPEGRFAGALPAPVILGCLDCRGDLERWEEWYRCTRCSIYYHPDLLAETPSAIWYRIQEGRMVCWECPPALPDMPRIHVGPSGEPVPCPIHGPAPER